MREAALTVSVPRPLIAKAISKARNPLGEREKQLWQPNETKRTKKVGVKGIKSNGRKLVHKYGTHISVIHYHNVARKKRPNRV